MYEPESGTDRIKGIPGWVKIGAFLTAGIVILFLIYFLPPKLTK